MEPQIESIQAGSVLEGTVSSITKFGAFVTLAGGRRAGLVHISEIANTFVNDVNDFLHVGQPVKVLVLSTENGRINLSIKKALPPRERPAAPQQGGDVSRPARSVQPPPSRASSPALLQQTTIPPSGDQAFEDKLKHFLSSSEGKIADLNRGTDGRRGRRRR